MNKINDFINKHYRKALLVISVLIFFNTCGNPNKVTNKRIETLSTKIDSLQSNAVTKKDLRIEGLKSEKRMIQATDRKMLDVQRQTAIEQEISNLEK